MKRLRGGTLLSHEFPLSAPGRRRIVDQTRQKQAARLMKQLRLTLPEDPRWLRINLAREALWINGQRKPSLVRLEQIGQELVLCDEASSGTLHLVASLDGSPECVLATAILMLRKDPYRLAVELARGQANKLRNLVAEWEREGWHVPDALASQLRDLAGRLCPIIQASQSARSDQLAGEWLRRSLEVGDEVVLAYSIWKLERRVSAGRRPRLGYTIERDASAVVPAIPDALTQFGSDWDDALIPIDWATMEDGSGGYDWDVLDRLVEQARMAGVAPLIGPVLDFRPGRLPGWVEHWQSDRAMLVTLLIDIVESVVGRYRDRVQNWIITAGTNSHQVLGLSVESLEWLTSRLLEAACHIDENAIYAVGVDQPWGWYAGGKESHAWPVDFAESVLRCRPQALSPIVLDISSAMDAERSLADLTKLLDRFRRLGVPLWVELEPPRTSNVSQGASASWLEARAVTALAKPWVERVIFSQPKVRGGAVDAS